jgi:hypothetical protein
MVLTVTNPLRQYSYDIPARGVLVAVVFDFGLSVLTAHLATRSVGIVFMCGLMAMSVLFAVLAEFVLVRRLAYPRMLELTDDAILFPHGFPLTTTEVVPYADIIRIEDYGDRLTTATGRRSFEIAASHFKYIEHYRAVREFISARTSIALPGCREQETSHWRGFPKCRVPRAVELPSPRLHWVEPNEWADYRTHLARSKPTSRRIGDEMSFFSLCLGFILFPWLVLRLAQLPTCTPPGILGVSLLAGSFFTVLHWLRATHPVRPTRISFRDSGVTQVFCNGQKREWNYHCLCGWAVIERSFEERTLHILLLKDRLRVVSIALPDVGVRDMAVQILSDKRVPQVSNVEPSWER